MSADRDTISQIVFDIARVLEAAGCVAGAG